MLSIKCSIFFAVLCVNTAVLAAKDIELQTPTVTTGKVSVGKSGFYLSNADTVSGPGNGFHVSHEPVHHFIIVLDALSPDKAQARKEELKKLAASGQPVTLQGEFFPIKERAQEYWGCRIGFEVKD
jgi:hypothetical protein